MNKSMLVGGVLGDADDDGVAFKLVPFVRFEVTTIGGGCHVDSVGSRR